jgi:hypothetical protein
MLPTFNIANVLISAMGEKPPSRSGWKGSTLRGILYKPEY